jgi:hypothetical protein
MTHPHEQPRTDVRGFFTVHARDGSVVDRFPFTTSGERTYQLQRATVLRTQHGAGAYTTETAV